MSSTPKRKRSDSDESKGNSRENKTLSLTCFKSRTISSKRKIQKGQTRQTFPSNSAYRYHTSRLFSPIFFSTQFFFPQVREKEPETKASGPVFKPVEIDGRALWGIILFFFRPSNFFIPFLGPGPDATTEQVKLWVSEINRVQNLDYKPFLQSLSNKRDATGKDFYSLREIAKIHLMSLFKMKEKEAETFCQKINEDWYWINPNDIRTKAERLVPKVVTREVLRTLFPRPGEVDGKTLF